MLLNRTKRYVTRIVSPRGEFHPWDEFASAPGQTYLSLYLFNRGEILPLPLFSPCLENRGKIPRRGNLA